MNDSMTFPDKIKDFLDNYSIIDKEQYYTNGAKLIPTFRVEQALEHYYPTVEKSSFQKRSVKLCPFRKRTYFMETRGKQEFNTSSNKAEFIEEDFLPCLKEQCVAHAYESTIHGNYALHYCTLLNNRLL